MTDVEDVKNRKTKSNIIPFNPNRARCKKGSVWLAVKETDHCPPGHIGIVLRVRYATFPNSLLYLVAFESLEIVEWEEQKARESFIFMRHAYCDQLDGYQYRDRQTFIKESSSGHLRQLYVHANWIADQVGKSTSFTPRSAIIEDQWF